MDPDLVALTQLSDHLTAALAAIGDEQLSWQTPCTDWELSDLVDHVTGGNWFSVEILDGRSADDALAVTMARFEGGSVTVEAATTSVGDQLAAFQRPGSLDDSWDHVAGPLPGRAILRIRLHDLIVHTWDIQHTLDPPASVPPPLLTWALAELADPASSTAEHLQLQPPVADTGDAARTAHERTAAYLERFGRHR